MNKQLSEAIARLNQLPEERQEAAAALLFEFLDEDDFGLTPEQLAEIDRRLDHDDIATDEEVKAFFDRMKA